jgi:phenylacetate-CoA ligase
MIRRLTAAVRDRLPFPLTHGGAAYRRYQLLLRRLETRTTEEIRAWQLKRLRALLRRAVERTDFYREHYRAAGVAPEDLRGLEDLARFPVITKDDVREHGRRMICRDLPAGSLHEVRTSGSTGAPLVLWVDVAAAARERAAVVHQWERAGYRDGAGRVEFRGLVESGELFQDFQRDRVLRVNVNRMEPADLPELLDGLARCPHPYWHGYPHALERLARLLEPQGLPAQVRPPRAILLASELVTEGLVELLERVFPASRLFAHYGLAERVALAGWIGESRAYHFLPGYGVVEVDGLGRLIGTSLINDAMPLIRYRTTDLLGGFHPDPTLYPGLFPVAERVEGREHDNLRTTAGAFVSPGLLYHCFKDGVSYLACRVIQHSLTQLEVQVERRLPEAEVRAEFRGIAARLKAVFGAGMAVELTLLEHIPRQPSGKFKWVESRLPV